MPQQDPTAARAAKPGAEKRRPSFFWVLAVLILPLWNLAVKYRFHHPERMPRTGAFVMSPNHYSEVDPVVMGVAAWKLGRAPRFLAKASLFKNPVLGWFLRSSGQIPVERSGSQSHAAIRAAEDLVAKGRVVIVYPEGSLTRDPDMWPMRGKTGAVRLALTGDIPLIPMAQWGAQQLMPRYGRLRLWPPRRRMTVVIGDPVDLSEYRATGTQRDTLTRATTTVMDRIAELLAGVRGTPAPAERWNPAAHGQKETGRLDS